MKTLRVPFALLLLIVGSFAQAQTPVPEAGAAQTVPSPAVTRTPEELDQLLGPIALYPDALIALILPAATAPADIVLAARYLRESPGDRSQIENRAWDESVKSLTNYPDVLKWMDENLQWTKQVGEAFAAQSADVMQAIQRLRAQARAVGTLADTPQQQVIAEPEQIRIVPAQPDVIYVPYYDPQVVFVDRPVFYPSPFLTFGVGVPVGSWLAFDCDWRRHTIWIGDRHRPWVRPDWRRPLVPFGPMYSGPRYTRNAPVRQWRPPPPRAVFTVTQRAPAPVVRPVPFHASASFTQGTAPLGSFADNRMGPTRPSSTAPTPARTFVPGGRRNASNPPSPSPASPPAATATFAPTVIAPPLGPTVSGPTVTPPPVQRRSGIEWSRDRSDNRPHNYSYSRGAGNSASSQASAPVVVSPAPQPAQPAPSASGYMYSRQPRIISQPNVAVAAPPVYRQPPAAVVSAPVQSAPAPAPQAAAPAAQPAPSPGPVHRGGGRRNAQEN